MVGIVVSVFEGIGVNVIVELGSLVMVSVLVGI